MCEFEFLPFEFACRKKSKRRKKKTKEKPFLPSHANVRTQYFVFLLMNTGR